MSVESHRGMILTGETEDLGENPVLVPLCPPPVFSWTDPGANSALRGERSATNRLSHGTTLFLDLREDGS